MFYTCCGAGFSESTGHFTQMVWAGTQALGCGSAQCSIGGAQGHLFVCNYSPAGESGHSS